MNLRLKNYIKHNINFVLSLAEDFESTFLTFENDIVSDTDTIQELQSKRQKFIEKKINGLKIIKMPKNCQRSSTKIIKP